MKSCDIIFPLVHVYASLEYHHKRAPISYLEAITDLNIAKSKF